MSDSVSAFVSSLETGETIAKSIESLLHGDPEAIRPLSVEGELIHQLGNTKAACLVSKLVLGEDAILDVASIQSLVELSWTKTCWLSPICVLRPRTAKQVAQILKISTFSRITFAIRSGGHSPNPGWASAKDALLIDLGNLNQNSVSPDRGTASVGPGSKWNDVIAYLDPFNVTVLAGRHPNVGVGGLILGGGVSHFTPEYGLVSDTLKNVDVVLADGTIVNANAQQNADLFWALKGGGSNFGIATRFDLQTIPIRNIWFESNLYAPGQAHALLEAFAKYQEIEDPKASIILSLTPNYGTVGLVYSAPVERPSVFASFYSIPVMQAAIPGTVGTVLQLNNVIASLASPIPQRQVAQHDYRGASSKVDAQLYKSVYDFWVAKAREVGEKTGSNATFVLQHIPKSAVDIGYASGGNALGLPRETQQWWTSIMDWDDQAHDDLVRSIGIETTAKWKELSEKSGLDNSFIYMNDASRDQNPLGSYPPEIIARLKAIARKYDPQGIFQNLQNGGFLLKDVL
ncbi:putative 6-hydroxy-D-nicotine oxidase [Periconia macrospinosa]|uniref:Putative 6-hydroxy-D-nicotine oxidase n=1 Tax=Periconia macrospinosa TaxID=97972 RepID=A0A2V1DVN3_9PLEO|nr:putative 6-hydroxy-D-nicotine oxidase [Periconia macrospinosa]